MVDLNSLKVVGATVVFKRRPPTVRQRPIRSGE
eukprot:COSAG02_NODE_696_length_18385_cov_48.260855_8_plen_33_part_00